jgi:hypothetical protein
MSHPHHNNFSSPDSNVQPKEGIPVNKKNVSYKAGLHEVSNTRDECNIIHKRKTLVHKRTSQWWVIARKVHEGLKKHMRCEKKLHRRSMNKRKHQNERGLEDGARSTWRLGVS